MVKTYIKFAIALAVSVLTFVSCNQRVNPFEAVEGANVVSQGTQLIPLQAGNTWTYTRILYDSQGNEGSRETEQHTVQLAVEIEDETWHQTNFAGFLINRPTGVWRRTMTILYGGEPHFGFPTLFIPYPLEAGDSTKVSTFYTYTLLEKGVAMTVPAGTFSCHHYRVTLSTPLSGVREYHRYYAPGVGFVKERWDAEPDPHEDSYEGITWYAGELLLENAELN